MEIPKTFQISRRAPRIDELTGLYDWLIKEYNNKKTKILELGCGITSWVLNTSVKPEIHVCFEQYKPCIETTLKHLPTIKMISTDWSDLPDNQYDICFVDSSTGAPKNVVPMTQKNPFRDDAIKYCNKLCAKNHVVIIHDWCHARVEWRIHRKYLEDNGYKLLHSVSGKYGFGIYKNPS